MVTNRQNMHLLSTSFYFMITYCILNINIKKTLIDIWTTYKAKHSHEKFRPLHVIYHTCSDPFIVVIFWNVSCLLLDTIYKLQENH